LIVAGSGLAVLLLILSPLLTQFLRVPLELLLAASAGIPFSLALPLLLGELQGEQRFMAFSTLSAGQAALKLIGALGLGTIWGTFGIIAGISLATIAIYFVALGLLRRRLSIKPRLPWMRPAAAYLVIVLPSTLALGVLLSTDVLLVKHFFAGRIAGEYAALAALGRSIFWGASGVAAVLFPKIVFRGTRGQSGKQLVFVSMVLVVIGGLGSLGVLSVGSQWLLTSFAGASYVGVASYLPWYGLGMILLGATAVLIAIHQSRGKPGFLAVLLPLTLLEPTLLLIFHQSLTQVVEVVDFSMALLTGSLGALYLVQQRAEHLATAPMPTDHATVADLVQAG
jgi:O-antigen/teichoic acid export membrane protein